eukprot:CAMPEP_0197823150 /NCGR_PEP_ID=MMETSP1437-20131217/472_1 /TAXON_ID=49252 ORGANISM="Eucampia antarctica, Strain CCMP1452" /NCGR_SAMPLE_ID=MMETSP1437 /ASSEMBLY_ACC=CAM_ASM_001096 /LENGTH=243 /DNA_ID=CAMNT_0043422157 /DNA_START=104 /DNA_END=835 /DNA_ORIENTATION=+
MKYSILSVTAAITLLSLMPISSTFGFMMVPSAASVVSSTRCFGTVTLVPEPEGGDEIDAVVPMINSRMKNMGQKLDETDKESGLPIYSFWLTSEADGAYVKEIRTKVLKDASKNANFPGFRKGQIPPYAQPQMTGFAIQESIIKTCESAVDAFGLKSLPGSAGSVEVLEDVKEMSAGYKQGASLQFTATFKAMVDPEKQPSKEEEVVEEADVVEAVVVEEVAEEAAVVEEVAEEAADDTQTSE